MTEAEWLACGDPEPMLEVAACRSSARKRRLFAVGCCRRIARVMTNAGSRAVAAAESFADGRIDEHRLHDAWLAVGYPKAENRAHAAAAARAACCRPSYDRTLGAAAFGVNASLKGPPSAHDAQRAAEQAEQARLLRDIFGNPFRPASFDPAWRTSTVLALASQLYESREFGAMPILADALQDAGCDSDDILGHCRDAHATHVRGCWVVDLVLGKE